MLKQFLPRQEGFFTYFQRTADILATTAIQFHTMLNDLAHQQQYVDAIAAYENDGDKIAHQTFELLHKTFITPFDRHDIHQLTSTLDDIIDLINRIAQRFPFFQLKSVPEEAIKLSKLSTEAVNNLKQAIYCLPLLKNSSEIFRYCNEI